MFIQIPLQGGKSKDAVLVFLRTCLMLSLLWNSRTFCTLLLPTPLLLSFGAFLSLSLCVLQPGNTVITFRVKITC